MGEVPAAESWADKLVAAADSQIGVTFTSGAADRKITYVGGDVPREVRAGADVIVRAYRDGLGNSTHLRLRKWPIQCHDCRHCGRSGHVTEA